MERWRGRTALVTGASSGIGRAIALDLSRAGMRVAVCARRQGALEALSEEAPGQVLTASVDLRDEAAVLGMFDAVDSLWGGVDVLVNNAGLGYATSLMDGDTAKWRETLEVNVLALSVCTREAIQRMRARDVDDGHIVHISSMSAHRVPPGSGMYAASKYAVRALTEALRQELRDAASGIRVTSISPGFVETGFAANYHGSEAKARQTYSRYRVLDDVDVAEAVRYVLGAPPHVQVHDLLMRPTEQPT